MEPLVDTVLEDPRWGETGLPDLAETAARACLAELGLPADGFALCVMGCDDARIAVLNADFRGKPQHCFRFAAEASFQQQTIIR